MNFTCEVTWSGGAGATRESDWSSLKEKNVVIWPDNDKEGVKAAHSIQSILTEINKNCEKKPIVSVINIPSAFPEKWDLADSFPPGFNVTWAKETIDEGFGKDQKDKNVDKVSVKTPTPLIQMDRHIALVLKENYDIDKDQIDKPMLKHIHQHLKLIDGLYKSATVTMTEKDKNHHIKQACYIEKKSQDYIDFYSNSSSPSKAREEAVKLATFEAITINRTTDERIDRLSSQEVINMRKKFDHAVLKTQENIQRSDPTLSNNITHKLADMEVSLMALTGGKFEIVNFINEKKDAILNNEKIIEKCATDLAITQSKDPGRNFNTKERLETARSAIIHEILRQETCHIKSSHGLVESSKKSITSDIDRLQHDRDCTKRMEQQRQQQQIRDNQLSL